jgi:predicted amidophosphoribosyltransferase
MALRGHNHAATIARRFAADTGADLACDLLQRVVDTPEQAQLPRPARARNVAGAFRATRTDSGTRVALVDDVVTSGSTARTASAALRAAGVERVDVWCVAKA